jgi:alpha-L-fucosidase 2
VGVIISILTLVAAAGSPALCQGHELLYEQPAETWDEAFPLGNGILGALVWGDGQPLNISLDRTDLWDLRPVPEYYEDDYSYTVMRQWEKEKRYEELIAKYDEPYHRPAPTKIPAGRITLQFPEEVSFVEGKLSLDTARSDLRFTKEVQVSTWIHARQAVGIIEVKNSGDVRFVLQAPSFAGEEDQTAKVSVVSGELSQLGYPAPVEKAGEDFAAFEQQGWGGFSFAVYLCHKEHEGGRLAAWSIASSREGDNPLALAKSRAEEALSSPDTLRESHEAWWRDYWRKGLVSLPNKGLEKQWYLEMYKFGAAARPDTPPITLQGPWTADDGKLPPWKGDYHHDLNTQLSYWPCYSGNRLEEGTGFLEWLWENKPQAEDWTRRFFDMPGLNVAMTTDLSLRQMGGWRQYTHSSTTGAWLAHHFYLHWRYSRDRQFLEERAWPWISECAVFLEAVTEERDSDGLRSLPLSSSPEINDNRPNAWFATITNYDNALIRWTFEKAAELAEELGFKEESAHWRQCLDEMPPLAFSRRGALLVAKDYPLRESHRHFSHAMAIHPLGSIDKSQGTDGERCVRATLRDLEKLGTKLWTGYSFSWLGNFHARAGDGAAAEKALEIFAEAFVLKNSFHCNGDQSDKGYSNLRYRPFTLEGNFAFAAAINEMLLQSHTDYIQIFPAVPESWADISFDTLRAEGAFLVSAERKGGVVTRVEILSETGAVPVLQCPWSGQISALHAEGMCKAMQVAREGSRWIITQNTP